MIRPIAVVFLVLTAATPATAVTCGQTRFEDVPYTVCEVDARTERMELFLRDADGQIFGQFTSVNAALEADGQKLAFAMNAGMYHDNRAPVGLYVEDSVEEMNVVPNAGPGNFGLLPNGVFCIRNKRADVIETRRFIDATPECTNASQSGPMLVIDGALHPRFLPDGTSKFIRNGVGTSADGTRAFFAISEEPVNFHGFGRFFRDYIKVPNALYLDGNISRLYAPQIGRSDFGFALGPIVGVVEDHGQ
ncbi:MAG: phosphodiester glycosidase family protein [Pseudomonadota bacterium]